MEHRWHDRKPTNLDVVIRNGDFVSLCKCNNISPMGMSVLTNTPQIFSKGKSVNLKLSLEKSLGPVYIEGIVANTTSKGMGLMFNHNNLKQIDRLEAYLAGL